MTFRILVIDDDHECQRQCEVVLKGADGLVTAAHSSVEGRNFLSKSPFDLLLVKTNMPDLDGGKITSALRAGGGPNDGIPVVGLTTAPSPAHVRECWRAGMNGLLEKPITTRHLLEKINGLGFGVTAPADKLTSIAVLDALSSDYRLRTFSYISRCGPITATTLAEKTPFSRQAALHHINALKRAGLVEVHARGREQLFEARPERLAAVAQWLLEVADQAALGA